MARIARVFDARVAAGSKGTRRTTDLPVTLSIDPDLDGIGREIADDGDHRVGAAPGRQLFEAGARVARRCPRAAPSTISVSKPAEVSSPFSRTSVSTMTGGELAGRTMMTLAARADAAPQSQVDTRIASASRRTRGAVQGARTNARAGPA